MEAGAVVAGYRLVDALGSGPFGRVFRAEDAQGAAVALKFLKQGFLTRMDGAGAFGRLSASLAVHAQVAHPYLARVFGPVQDPAQNAFGQISEYLPGIPLTQAQVSPSALRGHDPLGLAGLITWYEQLGDVLAWLHEQGMVHGNLKPTNVLLMPLGREYHIKLLDLSWSAIGVAAVARGPTSYVSPEQYRGEVPTSQSDQWALATMLERTFTGGQRRLSLGVLPAALVQTIQRATRETPGERYGGMAELVAALREIRLDLQRAGGDEVAPHHGESTVREGSVPKDLADGSPRPNSGQPISGLRPGQPFARAEVGFSEDDDDRTRPDLDAASRFAVTPDPGENPVAVTNKSLPPPPVSDPAVRAMSPFEPGFGPVQQQWDREAAEAPGPAAHEGVKGGDSRAALKATVVGEDVRASGPYLRYDLSEVLDPMKDHPSGSTPVAQSPRNRETIPYSDPLPPINKTIPGLRNPLRNFGESGFDWPQAANYGLDEAGAAMPRAQHPSVDLGVPEAAEPGVEHDQMAFDPTFQRMPQPQLQALDEPAPLAREESSVRLEPVRSPRWIPLTVAVLIVAAAVGYGLWGTELAESVPTVLASLGLTEPPKALPDPAELEAQEPEAASNDAMTSPPPLDPAESEAADPQPLELTAAGALNPPVEEKPTEDPSASSRRPPPSSRLRAERARELAQRRANRREAAARRQATEARRGGPAGRGRQPLQAPVDAGSQPDAGVEASRETLASTADLSRDAGAEASTEEVGTTPASAVVVSEAPATLAVVDAGPSSAPDAGNVAVVRSRADVGVAKPEDRCQEGNAAACMALRNLDGWRRACRLGRGDGCMRAAKTFAGRADGAIESLNFFTAACQAKVAEGCHQASIRTLGDRSRQFKVQACSLGRKASCPRRRRERVE